jgi:hypothetical protein
LKKRLEVYHNQTTPLVDYYTKQVAKPWHFTHFYPACHRLPGLSLPSGKLMHELVVEN